MTQQIPEGTPGEALEIQVDSEITEAEVIAVTVKTEKGFTAKVEIDTEVPAAMIVAQMLLPQLGQMFGQGINRLITELEEGDRG